MPWFHIWAPVEHIDGVRVQKSSKREAKTCSLYRSSHLPPTSGAVPPCLEHIQLFYQSLNEVRQCRASRYMVVSIYLIRLIAEC